MERRTTNVGKTIWKKWKNKKKKWREKKKNVVNEIQSKTWSKKNVNEIHSNAKAQREKKKSSIKNDKFISYPLLNSNLVFPLFSAGLSRCCYYEFCVSLCMHEMHPEYEYTL